MKMVRAGNNSCPKSGRTYNRKGEGNEGEINNGSAWSNIADGVFEGE